jgi:nucleoside-diphosphate-sugar epimerase
MIIVVTGGAGFLGSRVIQALLLADPQSSIISLDLAPCPVLDPRVRSIVGDIADERLLASAFDTDVSVVYHLAAIVSSQAEADFDLGMRVNFDATRALLERCRLSAKQPRVVFASSLAVFGGDVPKVVPESQAALPQSSYGTQKAMAELLINDYTRKGFIDGRVCRLPTISVRPGKPNAAASSFASGIIREPMAGQTSVCPVPLDTRLWLCSPDTVVANLVHAAELEGGALGANRTLNLPGICVEVLAMLDALQRIAGPEARARVTLQRDERIERIVCSWPGDFDITRPLALGFQVDASIDDLIRAHQRSTA